jgi:hypothetical protein
MTMLHGSLKRRWAPIWQTLGSGKMADSTFIAARPPIFDGRWRSSFQLNTWQQLNPDFRE